MPLLKVSTLVVLHHNPCDALKTTDIPDLQWAFMTADIFECQGKELPFYGEFISWLI